jgi:hypothetical protein
VEEAALLVDVEHLHRLEHLGELAGGNVGIDVEQLAVFGLGERGQDRERAGPDRSLDRRLVDADNLADEAVLVLVEVLGREDARRDGPSPGAELLESGDELEVLLEEDALRCGKGGQCEHLPSNKRHVGETTGAYASDLERLGVCDEGRQEAGNDQLRLR